MVTGLGVGVLNGVGKQAFWAACWNGRSGVGPIRTFDASRPSGQDRRGSAGLRRHALLAAASAQEREDHEPGHALRRRRRGPGHHRIQRSGAGDKNTRHASASSWAPAWCRSTCPRSRPTLVEACDARRAISKRRQLGQKGHRHAVSAVDPEIPAEHGGGPHLADPQRPGAEQHHHHRLRGRHPGRRRGVPPHRPRRLPTSSCAGGADSRIDPLLMLAYTALGALSQASRPAERGVASLRRQARRLRARRRGRRAGAGRTGARQESAARRFTPRCSAWAAASTPTPSPSPTPRPAAPPAPSSWALQEARVDAKDVDYINAHGTSTRLNDLMETDGRQARLRRQAPRTCRCRRSSRWSAI